MRVIIAGTPCEIPDSYAARLIEQGKAAPSPPAARAPKAKGKRKDEDVIRHEPRVMGGADDESL